MFGRYTGKFGYPVGLTPAQTRGPGRDEERARGQLVLYLGIGVRPECAHGAADAGAE